MSVEDFLALIDENSTVEDNDPNQTESDDDFLAQFTNPFFNPRSNLNANNDSKVQLKTQLKASKITKKKSPKTPVYLDPLAKYFQNSFYALIKNKKRKVVSKKCVIKYHRMACQKDLSITKINRKEYRSIKLYFKNHVFEMKKILDAIYILQEEGKINYLIDSNL